MKALFRFTFLLAIMASPLYLFSSGNPQPGDWLLMVAFVFAIFSAVSENRNIGVVVLPLPLFLLIFWSILVSLVWGLILSDQKSFIWAAFWVFNFLSTLTCFFFLNSSHDAAHKLSCAVAVAVGIAAFGALWDILDGGLGRISGTFNNPNQLAYFSLCSLALVLVLKDFKYKLFSVSTFATLGATFSILSASSLAAASALAILIAASVLANTVRVSRFLAFILGMLLTVVVGVYVDGATGSRVSENVLNRVDRASSKIDNVYEERNYSRIFDFPEYVFLGASESMHDKRFSDDVYFTEIHSSFGSLIFNYGIVGLFLFLSYLFFVFKKVPVYVFLAGMAPLAYSMTHMGLRTTMFWLFLISVYWKYNHHERC